MKYLLLSLVFLFNSCIGHSQKSDNKNSEQLKQDSFVRSIEYKSFLNFECSNDSTVLDYKELFGEWKFSYIAGGSTLLGLPDSILLQDSLELTTHLIINEERFYQRGVYDEKILPSSYRIESISVNDNDYNFKGSTWFHGYCPEKKTVNYLWSNKQRKFEIVNKDELACFAGYMGKYCFYIFHRIK